MAATTPEPAPLWRRLAWFVGIAAVIAVLAIGKGASTMMVREISSMGNNLMIGSHICIVHYFSLRCSCLISAIYSDDDRFIQQ